MKRFILVFLAVLILCGCTAQTPSPTVENTPTVSQTVTPTVYEDWDKFPSKEEP